MEKQLTEHMVESMSRCRDYAKALKLNFCNCGLNDISLCLKMPYLEVLSLSMNKITSLKSLVRCTRLKELYLRQNEIADFDELKYLVNAKSLTSLWLLDNPCSIAAGSNYRASVLRMLPNLKKLDNVDVAEEELESALRYDYYPDVGSAILNPVLDLSNCSPDDMAYRDMIEQCDRTIRQVQQQQRKRFASGDAKNIDELARIRSRSVLVNGERLPLFFPSDLRQVRQAQKAQDALRKQKNQPIWHNEQVQQAHKFTMTPQAVHEQVQGIQSISSDRNADSPAASTSTLAENLIELINSRRQDVVTPPGHLLPNVSSGLALNGANSTTLERHNNSLSAALLLIQDMNASQLETLVLAIIEQFVQLN
uniref:GH19655p n=2 Tax=Drosophila melanogaster TaxID=7227 RepID=Q9VZ54_DROME|nr:uncharacterized protein Dmel_CG15208, isoform B [Drosophila melanogaster]NP_001285100.1 uncharacterized protein Dmel_CG15208, isoform C [Drosophila melanogaster]NP_572664.1 uncharacterized protein Dmel_CG15208, isoform A [Drosophila melanogaster]ACL90689.1 CG15208-PA [synthetic construct]AAF47974.1 uncharacterized protein Dmel_CG15208, isoform A [Drosophila melanogaster]AAL28292.1 GH19655p [Drosophila melanogaster]AHN59569.1 uncharacterized protein Dmel_CG15208, isoform B [Drosophila melan|eukprot:NP_001285099.1 uncharacterized protein Dmel_CG15208, isoform B [Drosophila melanogaster]